MEHLNKASKTNSKHPDLKQLAIKGWLILSGQQKSAISKRNGASMECLTRI
jgi:hypothetical protein